MHIGSICTQKINGYFWCQFTSWFIKWRIFDTHLTSFLLLRVYSTLRSASEYLQTEGLDYLSAWNMVEKAKEVLKNLNFENIMETTKYYIDAVN
jgi:hypothetical protein